MFHLPKLASCRNRHILATEHPDGHAPEIWFSYAALEKFGLVGVNFDFFVDWRTKALNRRDIWLKRIVTDSVWPSVSPSDIENGLRECDGENHLAFWAAFNRIHGITPRYMLLPDASNPHVVTAEVSKTGSLEDMKQVDVQAVKDVIRSRSGGPIKMGKPLYYSASSLECDLSRTETPWPGDLDMLLLESKTMNPVAILEFKKHNKDTPIEDQRLANYYSTSDKKKYDRLNIFATDFWHDRIPFIVVYYSTQRIHRHIKLEQVLGKTGYLKSGVNRLLELPVDPSDEDFGMAIIETTLELREVEK